ncbi:MAG: tellurium resistance protein TerC [Pseudomonadota bacterium]
MESLLSIDNWFTLVMLIVLQAVLGFDNLLYISIESKRVRPDRQSFVRKSGIIIAVALRIVLLFVIINAISYFKDELFSIKLTGIFEGSFSGHALIVLAGGGFIIYTAVKEIFHMLAVEDIESGLDTSSRSVTQAIVLIVSMNLIFSVDSILSALALTDVFWVMATAIVLSGLMMLFLADWMSDFLQKNRMYEVLGLFILFIVGIMLVSEGGHLAHIYLFGYPVEAMAKTTFYFVLIVLFLVEIVQTRYRAKLMAKKAAEVKHGVPQKQ